MNIHRFVKAGLGFQCRSAYSSSYLVLVPTLILEKQNSYLPRFQVPPSIYGGNKTPPINRYECDKCGFAFPTGWGGYMYVENEKGERIFCPHPIEQSTVAQVLGPNASPELVGERTGYNSFCICLDCQYKFAADLKDDKANPWRAGWPVKDKDERVCPSCKSKNVRSVYELIGKKCPICGKGKIQEIPTGLIS